MYHRRRLLSRDGRDAPGPAAAPRPRPLNMNLGFLLWPRASSTRARPRYGDCLHAPPSTAAWSSSRRSGDRQGGLHRRPEPLHAGAGNVVLQPILGSRSVLLLDGAEHLRQRRLMLPPFHGERMRAYGEVMRAAAERHDRAWPRGRRVRRAPEHAGDHARGDPARRLRRRGAASASSELAAPLRAAARHGRAAAAACWRSRSRPGGPAAQPVGRGSSPTRRRADDAAPRGDPRRGGGRPGAERDDILSLLLARARRGRQRADRRGAARRADDAAGRRPRDDRDRAGVDARAARAHPDACSRGCASRAARGRRRELPRRDDQGDAAAAARRARRSCASCRRR